MVFGLFCCVLVRLCLVVLLVGGLVFCGFPVVWVLTVFRLMCVAVCLRWFGGFGCWVFLGLGLGLCSLGYCAWRVLGCDLKFSCGLVFWNLRV